MKRLVSLLLALLLLCAGQAFAGETRAEDFGTGSYHIPVIPIQFPDSPFVEGELELLEAALSGADEDVPYRSVKGYYLESSYGKLDLAFDILPVYTTAQVARSYARLHEKETDEDEYLTEELILQEAMTALDGEVDFSAYDLDADGMLDGVVMIYSYPMDYEDDDTLWWAWQNQSYLPDEFDGLTLDYYLWAGIDSLYEPTGLLEEVPCALTLIHETGHLLGLMDYYDTEFGDRVSGGLGGADMMDDSVGDHCSFSKQELGWIEPVRIEGSGEYALRSFPETGDALLLKKPNAKVSLLDRLAGITAIEQYEYLLIDLYTPDGLNAPFAEAGELFSQSGVRVYHVDARPNRQEGWYWDPYLYNNSTGDRPLIRLVEADGDGSIPNTSEYDEGGRAQDSDLFHAGDALTDFCWYDGRPLGYTIRVERLENGEATLIVEEQ